MKATRFEDLFREELEELHDAETQIAKALPKLIAAASSEELAQALQDHLDLTKEQIRRLDAIFQAIGEQPGSTQSGVVEALLREAERVIGAFDKSPALDAALIGAAAKVEHYEIAAYWMVRSIAEILGQQEAMELLQATLDEETTMDENLQDIAEAILTGEDSQNDGEELKKHA